MVSGRPQGTGRGVGFSLIAGSYPAYYGVPGVESRALLPEGRVPAGRAGGSEEGNHGL